jgi:CheY-like chemotaxis protein
MHSVDRMEWEKMLSSILVVDDVEVNRKVASLMLKKLGYQADIATNGVEAIEALEQKPYDIVLMDIQMPEMDGIEATKIIKERWHDSPKIIAVTAFANCRKSCFEVGVDDFLSKPLRINDLRDSLEFNLSISSFVSTNLEEFTYASDLCAVETTSI